MQETFDRFGALISQYHKLKCEVTSQPALMPKSDDSCCASVNAVQSRSMHEDKFCFIVDVENSVSFFYSRHKTKCDKNKKRKPIPIDCLYEIFISSFAITTSKYGGIKNLAKHFKDRIDSGDDIPKKLQYPANIRSVRAEMKDATEEHLINIGYLSSFVD